MRIGLFSDTFPPETNGVASSTGILRDELERHGQEVYVITTRAGSGMTWARRRSCPARSRPNTPWKAS